MTPNIAVAGRNMTSGGVVDDYDPYNSYGPPIYGAVKKVEAAGVLVLFCCFFSFLF
jgi:hypothetical protein